MHWSTDRRAFLRLSGAAFATVATAPRFAWAAEAGTLRLRVTSDFQVLDPFGIIGELDDIIPRMTQVTLIRISDVRDGNTLSNYAAEVFEWRDPQTIAFTLREGLVWTGDFGPGHHR
jgi:peptide/nickel transport system substrate-binding protein